MENLQDFQSIAPYLPPLKPESDELYWPNHQTITLLNSIVSGSINSGTQLYTIIEKLRNALCISRNNSLSPSTGNGFRLFFDELYSNQDSSKFFFLVLPAMANLLLSFPSLLSFHYKDAQLAHYSLRILKSQQPGLVLMDQELIGALLCCSFFCLIPTCQREADLSQDVNFDLLFASLYDNYQIKQEHKIRCLLNYFDRICSATSFFQVSFERKVLPVHSLEFWSDSKANLCEFKVVSKKIRRHVDPFIEILFSSKYLGGRVLSSICTQEEIRFLIHPEMMAGMLFLSSMSENETIEVVGAERYSSYKGCNREFLYAGNFVDKTPVFTMGRRRNRVVAMDALCPAGERQYNWQFLLREVNKSYCGFLDASNRGLHFDDGVGIVTGNWGRLYGGDPEIKSMIQWAAASQASRRFLSYFAFQDNKLQDLEQVVEKIEAQGWTVGKVWKKLLEYGSDRSCGGFFSFVLSCKN